METYALDLKPEALNLSRQDGRSIDLHPLWLRERVTDSGSYNALISQRLYEHSALPADLTVTQADLTDQDELDLSFSDNHKSKIPLGSIIAELGWKANPRDLPIQKAWTTSDKVLPIADWNNMRDSAKLKSILHDFLTYGFCIFENTPSNLGDLTALAGRFGFVRDTDWGQLFDVEKKEVPSDIAYTDAALGAHTDNPYREPIPGLQYLHCLINEVSGGLSTLTDGMAIARQLRNEAPEQADILERVNVRFRYEGPAAILESYGPIIERDHRGLVRRIRLSSRVDYVPALDVQTLDLFYKGRARLNHLANSPEFQIAFPFKKGTLLMMDNYRLLHGRTAFDGKEGRRHLQGCYTDHDGVSSLYRMLARGDSVTCVSRDK